MHRTTDVRDEDVWEVDIETTGSYHPNLFKVEAKSKYQAIEYAAGKLHRTSGNYGIDESDFTSISVFPHYE